MFGNVSALSSVVVNYVFADINGDDWVYIEDETRNTSAEKCARPQSKYGKASESMLTARTISGSDTTVINFAYGSRPEHNILHNGRCNFSGIKPVSPSTRDVDTRRLRVQTQKEY